MDMGTSFPLLEVQGIELAVDVDRDITLTVGTGFHAHGTSSFGIDIPVTAEHLKSMIDNLQRVVRELERSKQCTKCRQIFVSEKCPNCLDQVVY